MGKKKKKKNSIKEAIKLLRKIDRKLTIESDYDLRKYYGITVRMKDRKKEANKSKCRGKIRNDD